MIALAPWPVRWLDPAKAVAGQLMRVLYPSFYHWGPKPLPRHLTFYSTSGEISPVLQETMRGLCENKALSSPEDHLKTGVRA